MTESSIRTCPSCRLPFAQGEQVVKCPNCRTLQHYTCWQQHDGCVVDCDRLAEALNAPPLETPSVPLENPTEAIIETPQTPLHPEEIPPPPVELPPLDPALERLLSEIHLRIRQEQYEAAEQKLAEVEALASEHPAVLEIKGDIAFARRKWRQAEESYRKAFKGNPMNARLEEKFSTTLLKVHEPEYLSHDVPDDSPWNFRVKRNPAISAFASLVFPGIGQLYNGDLVKGIIVTVFGMGLWAGMLNYLYTLQKTLSLTKDQLDILVGYLFHGSAVTLPIALILLWVYSIVDAAVLAKYTE